MTPLRPHPVLRRLAPAIALWIAQAAAQASGTLLLLDPPPAQTSLSVGATVRGWPETAGASQQRHQLWPAIDYAAPNGAFASTDDSVGWNLAPVFTDAEAAQRWQWGVRLWPQFGRPARHVPPGISPRPTRVLAEAFANVQALPFLLLQSGFSWGSGPRRDGAQLELGATTGLPIGDELIGIGLAASYANSAQLRSTFGVSPAEARASGLPSWQPGRGWQDWSTAISWEHKFSAQWSISGQWLGTRLLGAAAGSPLTATRVQPSFTLSVWRRL